ncbi:type I restriction-modification system subunit M [Leucothrix arctica]|uniref:site-specific DNA-methyltransferase (adenine-specific) n=1 Tax=Leucothrix arctica TaxID=1481894 RepID=A0A317C461_9GAMM|nr:class I SAM-dependent DNA methyltransferase [Leucothrix arctica]PWQ93097.1 N-6 DNA methylase [Leucothrix arctica]
MNTQDLKKLENDLWSAADSLRANSGLKASEYAAPILGLIFLRFVDNKYSQFEAEINAEFERNKGGRNEKSLKSIAVAKCRFYLPETARYQTLLNLSDAEDIALHIKHAMQAVEDGIDDDQFKDVLPKDEYAGLSGDKAEEVKTVLNTLLRVFEDIPVDAGGDVFGKIYEYFLGKFALAEGQGGGEFFTPESVVKFMVAMIEPSSGTIYDPACGSGGMFVQSAHFIDQHRTHGEAREFTVRGQEKSPQTAKLARMNLFLNDLKGEISTLNSYYENPFDSVEQFDYVMANPPFNVDDVNLTKIKDQKRFNTYGIPQKKTKTKKVDEGKETVPNANYLWINLFATSLKAKGRAGLVMANSASDARHSEAEIRQKLIEENLIYSMVTLPSNMFYTVTLPATLWFFDKDKKDEKILFIDARNVFTQIDRAHREFSDDQVRNLALIGKLHREDREEFTSTISDYFKQGIGLLKEQQRPLASLRRQVKEALPEPIQIAICDQINTIASDFKVLWLAQQNYQQQAATKGLSVGDLNKKQQAWLAQCEPYLDALKQGLKQLDKTLREHEKGLQKAHETEQENEDKPKRFSLDKANKQLRKEAETLHDLLKQCRLPFVHIRWLQDRFPEAKYEDVTGLCKLASLAEVQEQDYSLNAGRYVGVVIEEDGKTEEEFLVDLQGMNAELERLNKLSVKLSSVIGKNMAIMCEGLE